MNKIFLDTSALIEVVNGTEKGKKVLNLIKQSTKASVSLLSLYEVWYLSARAYDENMADNAIASVKNLSSSFPVSEEVCLKAAKLKKAHKSRKTGTVDLIIAASAILSDSTIITSDNDFRQITEAKAEFL